MSASKWPQSEDPGAPVSICMQTRDALFCTGQSAAHTIAPQSNTYRLSRMHTTYAMTCNGAKLFSL